MSDFGFSSTSSSSSSSGMNGAQRAELMDQVKSQLLVATLQELLSVSIVRCWLPVHVLKACNCNQFQNDWDTLMKIAIYLKTNS